MKRPRTILTVVVLSALATIIMYNALTTLYTNHIKYPGREKSGYQKSVPGPPNKNPGKAPRIVLRSLRTDQDINRKGSGIMQDVSKDLKKSEAININSKVKDLIIENRHEIQKTYELKDILSKNKIKNESVLNSVNLVSNIFDKTTNNISKHKITGPIDITTKNSKSINEPSNSKITNVKYRMMKTVDSQNSASVNDKESDPLRGWWRTHLCKPSPAPWRYKEGESKPITLSRDISYLETTEKNIFLLETSCAQVLGPRVWCALESLAHKNPNHQVTLFLTSPTLNDAPGQEYIKADGHKHLLPDNVHLVYVDLEDLFMGSPLERVYLSGTWYAIPELTVLNVSDILRLLLVHKYGGTYLDLDIINIKPLDDITNFVGRQSDTVIANGVFGFKKGHWFPEKILHKISKDFMAGPRGYNGPYVFTKTVLEECGDKALLTHKQIHDCKGLNILSPSTFYPVPYERWEIYFTPGKGKKFLKSWPKAYLLHFWNEFSSKTSVALGSGSAYEVLASLHCPRLYRELMHSPKWLL